MALGVALAIIRVTEPTWNMKQRLARTRACAASASRVEYRNGGGVGFVDSARDKNKAHAVVEIYRAPLKRGRCPWLLPL